MLSVEAAGNNEPPSGTNGLQVRREAQDFRRRDVKADALMTASKQGNRCLYDEGRKSEKKLPALAARLRAFRKVFSSSSASSVRRKAFPESKVSAEPINFNTARFFLSRLEILSAAPTSLSFLRFHSKSSKSSEGGQRRDCVFRVSLLPVVSPSVIHTGRPSLCLTSAIATVRLRFVLPVFLPNSVPPCRRQPLQPQTRRRSLLEW